MISVADRARRRGALFGALIVLALPAFPGPAEAAACRLELLTGQWQHLTDNSRWAFFTSKRVDCRTCRDWNENGGCVYVADPTDEQGRRQCTWSNGRETTRIVPGGKVTVTGWDGKDGVLDRIIFSDGSVREVAAGCNIDGAKGIMTIEGIGEFQCHYNYQCDKLSREAK